MRLLLRSSFQSRIPSFRELMYDPSEHSVPPDSAGSDGCWGLLATAEKLTPERFDPHVGEVFRVAYQQFETAQTHVFPRNEGDVSAAETGKIIELKLVSVTRYPRIKEREGGFDHRPREPFSVLLAGPRDLPLMCAEYTVDHDQLGKGRMFLSPVQVALKQGAEEHELCYEAVYG